jgi:hypothetical protein
LTVWRYGSTLEMVELALRPLPRTATMVASSGTSALASSQPCRSATARSSPSLSRPMRPERAISRTVSPARSRTSTCRYWNISILLRPTAASSCAEKDNLEVEFSLKSKGNPIGVAEYQLQTKLPAELKGKLPSPKQLQDLVRDVLPDLEGD